MKLPLATDTWQALRVLVRNKNTPVVGKKLRLKPTRATKDGTFLDKLVTMGLLELVAKGETPKPRPGSNKVIPAQFCHTYRLTPAGIIAADYGEYDKPDPCSLPVHEGSARPKAKRTGGR